MWRGESEYADRLQAVRKRLLERLLERERAAATAVDVLDPKIARPRLSNQPPQMSGNEPR